MNKERLLNVAKALRETNFSDEFTMNRFGHSCGTPACALGNYAVRRDLQSAFSLSKDGSLRRRRGRIDLGIDDDAVLEHFGITFQQSKELFAQTGCGNAESAGEAATYIERFVAKHS